MLPPVRPRGFSRRRFSPSCTLRRAASSRAFERAGHVRVREVGGVAQRDGLALLRGQLGDLRPELGPALPACPESPRSACCSGRCSRGSGRRARARWWSIALRRAIVITQARGCWPSRVSYARIAEMKVSWKQSSASCRPHHRAQERQHRSAVLVEERLKGGQRVRHPVGHDGNAPGRANVRRARITQRRGSQPRPPGPGPARPRAGSRRPPPSRRSCSLGLTRVSPKNRPSLVEAKLVLLRGRLAGPRPGRVDRRVQHVAGGVVGDVREGVGAGAQAHHVQIRT